jgi:molybdopterin-guanine dinucleotide biosynthesis protein B
MSDPAIRYSQRPQRPSGALKPVLAVVGHSGSGKTSLLEHLLPILTKSGLRVGLMKHAHQGFDMDRPGKDSHRLRAAGAQQVMVASAQHWALLADTPEQDEPDLETLLARLEQASMDLILLEGFKHADLPKLEVYRPAHGKPPLYPDDPQIIAVATDSAAALDGIETLDLNRPQCIADFIRSTLLDQESSHGGF